MDTLITSYFTYFSHGISYWILWNIQSKNAEAVSQGFYMVIFTRYFKFLWNNMWKTMWNPCKTLSKFHILFTWNSDTFHMASPSSELEVWIVQAPITRDPDKKKIINTCTLLLFSGLPLLKVMLMGHSLSTARFVKFLIFLFFIYSLFYTYLMCQLLSFSI